MRRGGASNNVQNAFRGGGECPVGPLVENCSALLLFTELAHCSALGRFGLVVAMSVRMHLSCILFPPMPFFLSIKSKGPRYLIWLYININSLRRGSHHYVLLFSLKSHHSIICFEYINRSGAVLLRVARGTPRVTWRYPRADLLNVSSITSSAGV